MFMGEFSRGTESLYDENVIFSGKLRPKSKKSHEQKSLRIEFYIQVPSFRRIGPDFNFYNFSRVEMLVRMEPGAKTKILV